MLNPFKIVRFIIRFILKAYAFKIFLTVLSKFIPFRICINYKDFESRVEDGSWELTHNDENYQQVTFKIFSIKESLQVFSLNLDQGLPDNNLGIAPEMVTLIRFILFPLRLILGKDIVKGLDKSIIELEIALQNEADLNAAKEMEKKVQAVKLAREMFAS
jgi:hypothetical protein